MTDRSSPAATLARWDIPGIASGAHYDLDARAGEVTCIVGSNGAGKSALGTWLDSTATGQVRRILAHRQLWFQAAGPDVTASQRQANLEYNQITTKQTQSRYLDQRSNQRAGDTLFDLLAMETAENRRALGLIREGRTIEQATDQLGRPVFERLNAVLTEAGLKVEIITTEQQLLNARDRLSGAVYPIFQMSDGEKSALLLAADVLTSPDSCVLIIDEPERHLHRAISASLIEAVMNERPDCHFVILTHDLELTDRLGRRAGQVLTVTGSSWTGASATGWDLGVVDSQGLPEAARAAILGGRTRVLLIEGDTSSHDQRLYQLLYPGWSLLPAGGADQVINAVTGLRDTDGNHWLHARGIVDGDARDAAARLSLSERGILALGVSEVENVYYLDCVLATLSAAHADHLGHEPGELLATARQRGLAVFADDGVLQRLAAGVSLKALRLDLLRALPTDCPTEEPSATVTVVNPYAQVLATVRACSAANDLQGLVTRLPVRDTAFRDRVARALRYPDAAAYEAAAARQISRDAQLRSQILEVIGTVPE